MASFCKYENKNCHVIKLYQTRRKSQDKSYIKMEINGGKNFLMLEFQICVKGSPE